MGWSQFCFLLDDTNLWHLFESGNGIGNFEQYSGRVFFFLFYFFLAALGLRCCTQAFSSCGEQGLLCVVVHGLLTAVASLVSEHGL